MKWLNIEIATLRSAEYIGAEPVERATWLSLLGYCADQENGGRIRDCKRWKDRQWQQVCGITATEAAIQSRLWRWDDSDVVVTFYPTEKEHELRNKRQAGFRGGKASGKARREAQLEAQLEAPLEGKGKGNGNGMEGNDVEQMLDLGVAGSSQHRALSPKAKRKPQAIDEPLLVELINDEAYRGIDVRKEFAKMSRWCKTHGKHATPKRLIAWLNRAEVPSQIAADTKGTESKALRPYEVKMKAEAIRKMIEKINSDYANKQQSEEGFGWTLKPEAKARIAELRAKLRELDQQMVE